MSRSVHHTAHSVPHTRHHDQPCHATTSHSRQVIQLILLLPADGSHLSALQIHQYMHARYMRDSASTSILWVWLRCLLHSRACQYVLRYDCPNKTLIHKKRIVSSYRIVCEAWEARAAPLRVWALVYLWRPRLLTSTDLGQRRSRI